MSTPSLLNELVTPFERYQITVALACFAFLANHTSHLLPVTIDRITHIGLSGGPHALRTP